MTLFSFFEIYVPFENLTSQASHSRRASIFSPRPIISILIAAEDRALQEARKDVYEDASVDY